MRPHTQRHHTAINTFSYGPATAALVVLILLAAGPALGQSTERVSVDSAGNEADFPSDWPSISPDGRFVAFSSLATNLVPGDTNGDSNLFEGREIFVHDRSTGVTERVSVSSQGEESERRAEYPHMSADGRLVVFGSTATNLVPNDTNGRTDVFLRDRALGATVRVNVSTAGEEANSSTIRPKISADGSVVVFESLASNLVPSDLNGKLDIFVRDLVAGVTERVSVDSAGNESGGPFSTGAMRPAVSADGRFVTFESTADDLLGFEEIPNPDPNPEPGDPTTILVPIDSNGGRDVFIHDRLTGTTEWVSADDPGAERATPSADARFVVFRNNLAVLVRDRLAGITERADVDSAGVPANGFSRRWTISPDGRFVGFVSTATNLVPGDTNGSEDVFVHDRLTGVTERVSVDSNGNQANGPSFIGDVGSLPWISADGRFVAFASCASNLVANDTGDALCQDSPSSDMFVRDRLGTATATGTDVVEQPPAVDDGGAEAGGPVTLIFDEVTVAGDTTVTVTENGPAPPQGFSLGDPPVYFDVETTATFVGNVEVCISYGGFTFSVDESELRLYHDDGGGLMDVTSSQDTALDVICGIVASLSPFAILQPADGGGDPQDLLADLAEAIAALGLQQGLEKSFDAKLAAVARAMDDVQMGDDVAAVGALQALVAELEAQSGVGIASQDAEALIADANAIIALLEDGA